jgi:type IV pilus assembly protein PilN
MRININLATRPFADVGPAIMRLRIGMGVLAITAIALGFGLHAVHHNADQARQRESALDSQIARITQERHGYQNLMEKPENAQLLQQADTLNRLFDEKAFSWTLAMENLETVLPGGVQVSTLEPIRAKDGHITLHLRVVGPRDRAVELVRNLEHSRRFVQPRIVGETSDSNESPNQQLEPVSATNRFTFDVLADYTPPTQDETRPASRHPEPKTTAAHEATAPSTESPAAAPPPALHKPARPPYVRPTSGGPR